MKILVRGVLLTSFFMIQNVRAEDSDCSKAGELMKQGLQMSSGDEQEEGKYREASKLCPRMPEAFYNLGVVLGAQKKYAESLSAFEQAISLKAAVPYLVGAGRSSFDLGRVEDAEKYLLRAKELDPKSLIALEALGFFYAQNNQAEKSLSVYQEAISLSDATSDTRFNLALIQARLGKKSESEETFERILNIDPNHVETLLYKSSELLASQKYAEAEVLLSRAAKAQPENVMVQKNLATTLHKLGDLERSELSLRRALDVDPKNDLIRIQLGSLLLEKSQAPLAVDILTEVTKASPQLALGFGVLGRALIELGKYAEAEKSIRNAIALDSNDASFYNDLGVLYRRQGREKEAEAQFQAALEKNPGFEIAKKNLEK